MSSPNKRILFFALSAAILAIVALAAGISGLDFAHPDLRQVVPPETGELPDQTQRVFADETVPIANLLLAIIMLVSLLLTIIHAIISPEARQQTITRFIAIVIMVFLTYLVTSNLEPGSMQEEEEPLSMVFGESDEIYIEEMDTTLPAWVSFAASLFLVSILVAVAWLVWRRTHRQPSAVNQLALEARTAMRELRSGAEFKNTIIHCYYQMCAILDRERGINRPDSMTAREFEERLTRLGFPASPVNQLTRLFEKARYSSGAPDPQDERIAWDCLSVIAVMVEAPGE